MKKTLIIGTSGWNYPHWKKVFYPETLPRKDWLAYYAGHFTTVEVNNTFYKWPDVSRLQNWHENTPDNFVFSVKCPRYITHMKKLKDAEEYAADFLGILSRLGKKAGPVLFQLPPRFKFDGSNLDRLGKFLSALPRQHESVFEFRDPGWWNEKAYRLLDGHGASFCTVYGLDMPREALSVSGRSYFRFHGENYSGSYTEDELKAAADRIKKTPAEKIYAYFNNDENAFSVENAFFLKRLLDA